jgi:hypothetical protein
MDDKEVEYRWRFPKMTWDRVYGSKETGRLINRDAATLRDFRRRGLIPPTTVGHGKYTPVQVHLMRRLVRVLEEWPENVCTPRRRRQAVTRCVNTIKKHWSNDDARFDQEQAGQGDHGGETLHGHGGGYRARRPHRQAGSG